MNAALLAAAALMGLAGAPHCTAMCSAACSLAVRRCAPAQPVAGSASFLKGVIASIRATSSGSLRMGPISSVRT